MFLLFSWSLVVRVARGGIGLERADNSFCSPRGYRDLTFTGAFLRWADQLRINTPKYHSIGPSGGQQRGGTRCERASERWDINTGLDLSLSPPPPLLLPSIRDSSTHTTCTIRIPLQGTLPQLYSTFPFLISLSLYYTLA